MKTIQTVITVLPDGSIQIPPRPDLPPGEHQAVLVVEETAGEREPRLLLKLKMLDTSGSPADGTFRREEIYGDDGR